MYVRRLRLYGVKMLHRDIPETGEALPNSTRRRLLLQGGTGSGLTTILDCIRLLWEYFGVWIDAGPMRPEHYWRRRGVRAGSTEEALGRAELAAMELGDFPVPGKVLWIGTGEASAWEALRQQHPGADFAGLVRFGKELADARIVLPNGDWQTFRQRSMVGSEPQANIVHFRSDNRVVSAPPEDGPRLLDTTPLNWSALYSSELDLDSVLLTVEALRPQAYDEILNDINLALRGRNKRIVGFGDDGRLRIEGQTEGGMPYHHPPEQLSSGEQQYLVLVAYTVGFLRPGGVLLIDEPVLSIHWALIDLLLQSLDIVARQRGGQLIVASHEEHVAEWFSRDSEKLELNPWRRREAMSSPPKPVPAVQQILNAGPEKVLLVEGPTDLDVCAIWLDRLAFPARYTASLVLVSAGAKNAVVNCLEWFADNGGEPRVFGLVDRDEWDAATIARMCANLPKLRVNPDRHAIESYFSDPQEIWPALLAINPLWASQAAAFQASADAARLDYVAHWALLTVTDRIKVRMNDLGYPGYFSETVPVPADPDIRNRFEQWARTIDATAAFADFDTLRSVALGAAPIQQFRTHVWAKLFFERVIRPGLNLLSAPQANSAHDWMTDLAENAPSVPSDLEAILRPLL